MIVDDTGAGANEVLTSGWLMMSERQKLMTWLWHCPIDGVGQKSTIRWRKVCDWSTDIDWLQAVDPSSESLSRSTAITDHTQRADPRKSSGIPSQQLELCGLDAQRPAANSIKTWQSVYAVGAKPSLRAPWVYVHKFPVRSTIRLDRVIPRFQSINVLSPHLEELFGESSRSPRATV